jgi:hypothetical protein
VPWRLWMRKKSSEADSFTVSVPRGFFVVEVLCVFPLSVVHDPRFIPVLIRGKTAALQRKKDQHTHTHMQNHHAGACRFSKKTYSLSLFLLCSSLTFSLCVVTCISSCASPLPSSHTSTSAPRHPTFHHVLASRLMLSHDDLAHNMAVTATGCGVSPLDATANHRNAPLSLLLQSMSSLLLHQRHSHSLTTTPSTTTTAASTTSEEEAVATSIDFTCRYCRLTKLLCHWAAARLALPDDVAERFLVTRTTRQQLQRQAPCTGVDGDAVVEKSDALNRSNSGPYGPFPTAAYCTAAYLLPAMSWDRKATSPKSGTLEGFVATASTAQALQRHDALLQEHIDALFRSLRDGGGCDEGAATSNEESSITKCWTALFQLYDKLKHDDSYLFRPALQLHKPLELLLKTYAMCSTELAALALLRVMTSDNCSLPSEAKLRTVSRVFRGLLDAQQAARAAVCYCHSSRCERYLRTCIRPLLDLLTLDNTPATPTSAFPHPHVEWSADPLGVVSGRGLVAIGAIHEGERLLQEACLLAVPDTVYFRRSEDPSENRTTFANLLDRALPHVEEIDQTTHEESAAEPDLSFDDELTTTAAHVMHLAARRSAASADSWWWFRWALTLPEGLPLRSDSSGAHRDRSMRECVREAVLAAYDTRMWGSTEQTSIAVDTELWWSSLQPLHFMPLRGADELHLPLPPTDGASHPFRRDPLLPSLELEGGDALFCMLQLVNHACTPNAMVVYDTHASDGGDGVVVTLVALRHIDEGEEITISYAPATTALTVSQAELTKLLGFACRCGLCTQKAALLHGVVCGECKQLVWASPTKSSASAVLPEAGESVPWWPAVSSFHHAVHCSRRDHHLSRAGDRGGGDGEDHKDGANTVAEQLRRQLDRIAAQTVAELPAFSEACESTKDTGGTEGDVCDCRNLSAAVPPVCGAATRTTRTCAAAVAPQRRDPLVGVVRQLLDLDDCVAHTLLPTHHLRLRTRLEAFTYASVARGLSSTVSAELIQRCANTIEELEVLLGANHPLLTGLRMHLVFSRGRHLRAVQSAEAMAHGTRHADCCGAVREQAVLMTLPFVVDPLVRRCVVRCFQEHYVQLMGWKLPVLGHVAEDDVLWSFLHRYPVELDAAGITTPAHVELLACMEDSESAPMD